MKFKDMKRTTDKYGFEYVGNDVLVGKNKESCLTCKELTEYVEVFSEAHFCSEECVKAFYNQLHELEQARYSEIDAQ